MVNDLLQELGLNPKEIAIYLCVLKHGKMHPSSISKETRINRSTVYSSARELIKKGFLLEDLAGPNSSLIAINPGDLNFLIKKEEQELTKKKHLIETTIKSLQELTRNSEYPIPKIVFIQENDLEDYLYKRSDVWHASIMERDGILWGFQDHTFAEHYEKWIDWEWQVGGPKDLRLRLLSNESSIEKKNTEKGYSRRQIKFWPSESFTATVWVHGDYLILVQTRSRPHYLVEIHDVLLASNMRQFFNGVWEKF